MSLERIQKAISGLIIKEPFFGWARQIIIVACIVYAVLVVLLVVFGVRLLIDVTPVCGS